MTDGATAPPVMRRPVSQARAERRKEMEYKIIITRKNDYKQQKVEVLKGTDLEWIRANAMVFRASCRHVWIYAGKELIETVK